MAGVQVINSLKPEEGYGQQWRLILQWCRYFYDDGSIEHGYRFIRVTPEGRLQPARGQNNLLSEKKRRRQLAPNGPFGRAESCQLAGVKRTQSGQVCPMELPPLRFTWTGQ